MSPSLLNNELSRLRDELVNQSAKHMNWEDRIIQASKACEAWKSEADESNRKVKLKKKSTIIFVIDFWFCHC